MATVSLDAKTRTDTGKGAARKLRAKGLMPAVVYSFGSEATPIAIEPDAIEMAFQKTQDRNTLVELAFADGAKRTCLVRDVQRHPVTRRLEHIDFYQLESDRPVTVKVDVNPVGTAVGTKIGGRLRVIKRHLQVRCKPADIPRAIDIDVTEMVVGDLRKISDITPPKGCELVADADANVLAIIGKSAGTGSAAESAAAGA